MLVITLCYQLAKRPTSRTMTVSKFNRSSRTLLNVHVNNDLNNMIITNRAQCLTNLAIGAKLVKLATGI